LREVDLFDLELCDTYCDDVRLRDGQSPFSSSNLHHFSSVSQVSVQNLGMRKGSPSGGAVGEAD